jgi:spore coat protein CotH
MIKSQFGEEGGNMHRPESNLSALTQSLFEKKNNDLAADYSDVKAFIAALNSGLRTTNPSGWRSGLQGVFNMDQFLKYLAVNNAIVNWDSYGVMAHNFYFFNHTINKLTWIPWDHNEAMTGSPGITSTPQVGGGARTGLSLSMNEVTNSWPLIRYIADDPVFTDL